MIWILAYDMEIWMYCNFDNNPIMMYWSNHNWILIGKFPKVLDRRKLFIKSYLPEKDSKYSNSSEVEDPDRSRDDFSASVAHVVLVEYRM